MLSISYQKSLWICSPLQNPVSEQKQFQIYSYAALKCKSKTEKDYFDLTNLFFKTGFCKNQWKPTEVIRSATPWAAFRETHITKRMRTGQGDYAKSSLYLRHHSIQGESATVLHTFDSSASSLCFIAQEQLCCYVADRQIQNSLTGSSACQLHAKYNPRPCQRFTNTKV